MVFLTQNCTFEDSEGNLALASAAIAFTEGNTDYIISQLYEQNDEGSVDIFIQQNNTGFEIWTCLVTYDYGYYPYMENLNYIAIKYTDAEDSEAVYLPTLANPGNSSDLAAGKQLIDANGNVVFGSKTSVSKTTTTKLSSADTTITFTGLTAQPKMFSIVPTTNITLSSTRYVTGVTYDGTTTHGVYGYRQSSSATSYYSSSYFTWTYSNGTLTVKTNSSTNGGNFTNSVAYQLTYVVEDEVSVGGSSVQKKEGTFTTDSSGEAIVNCGFQPDIVMIHKNEYGATSGRAYTATAVFSELQQNGHSCIMWAPYESIYIGYDVNIDRESNGFYTYITLLDSSLDNIEKAVTYNYVAIKYT